MALTDTQLQKFLASEDVEKTYLIEQDALKDGALIVGTDISFDPDDNSVNVASGGLKSFKTDAPAKLMIYGSPGNSGTFYMRVASDTKILIETDTAFFGKTLTVEAAGTEITLGLVEVIRIATGGGYTTRSNDKLKAVEYLPRMAEDIKTLFIRRMFSFRTTQGASDVGRGGIEVANIDGDLDHFFAYSFNGQMTRLLIGSPTFAYDDFYVVSTGQSSGADWELNKLSIAARDNQYIFEKPLTELRYDGTNDGADGDEGTPNDIMGNPKVWCYGENYAVPLVATNISAGRMKASTGSIEAVVEVRENSAPYEITTDYTEDLAAGGIVLVGSKVGLITADIKGDNSDDGAFNGYVDSAAYIGRRIAINHAGISYPSGFDTAAFEALHVLNPASIGIFVDNDTTIGACMDDVFNSIGGWYGCNRRGLLSCGLYRAPQGNPRAAFDEIDILDIVPVKSKDDNGDVPPWQVVLNIHKHYATQDKGAQAGSVAQEDQERYARQWRKAYANDNAIKAANPLSLPMYKDSLLVNQPDGDAEALRLLGLYGVPRPTFEVTVKTKALFLDIGDEVTISYPRWGLDNGKDFVIIGFEEDVIGNTIKMTIRGAERG